VDFERKRCVPKRGRKQECGGSGSGGAVVSEGPMFGKKDAVTHKGDFLSG